MVRNGTRTKESERAEQLLGLGEIRGFDLTETISGMDLRNLAEV